MPFALRLFPICLVAILATSVVCAGTTEPWATPATPAPCGFGGLSYHCWPAGLYTREYIAYHALHPPVYYSYPIPRTYGYSPFAYPPGTRTPEIAAPTPEVVPNPHVPQKETVKPTANRLAHAPLRIRNPFVQPLNSDGLSQHAKLSALPNRLPQVVYPARMAEQP